MIVSSPSLIEDPVARPTPRVLVTDAQERSVLAAIRCLARSGFDVIAVGTSRVAPGLWSRLPVARRLAPDARTSVEAFLAALRRIIGSEVPDMVLPGTDASLFGISSNRDRLDPLVQRGLPPHEAVEAALDRVRLIAVAAEVGLPGPPCRSAASLQEALAVAAELGYPVLVKPAITVLGVDGSLGRWASALVCDPEELESTASDFPGWIVQSQVPGTIVSVGGAASSDGLLGLLVSRYVRTWPPQAGSVSFSQTIDEPVGLRDRVQSLVRGLGWEGMFELELIEGEDGRLGAIDFNPRPYGSLALARAAGVPLASLWCAHVLGLAGPNVSAVRPPVRYRWEDADVRSLLRTSPGEAARALLPRRATAHAYFEAGDPGPLLARAVQMTTSRGSGRPRRSSA